MTKCLNLFVLILDDYIKYFGCLKMSLSVLLVPFYHLPYLLSSGRLTPQQREITLSGQLTSAVSYDLGGLTEICCKVMFIPLKTIYFTSITQKLMELINVSLNAQMLASVVLHGRKLEKLGGKNQP